jgi:hypothetical protein
MKKPKFAAQWKKFLKDIIQGRIKIDLVAMS